MQPYARSSATGRLGDGASTSCRNAHAADEFAAPAETPRIEPA
jgi:hypothetical protein